MNWTHVADRKEPRTAESSRTEDRARAVNGSVDFFRNLFLFLSSTYLLRVKIQKFGIHFSNSNGNPFRLI